MTHVRTLAAARTKIVRNGYADIAYTGDPIVEPPPPSSAKFAGHIANRVKIGIAAADGASGALPTFSQSLTIIGQPIYETRQFVGNPISTSGFNSMMADADSANATAMISFKEDNWSTHPTGGIDSQLLILFNAAVARRAAGKSPFLATINHEPAGDGSLAEWSASQAYCAHWFSGRRGGTAASPYNAAHDVSDILVWAPIGNGFWWRKSGSPAAGDDANVAWSSTLLTALRMAKGVILNDFYDADYVDQTRAMTDPAYRTPGTGVKTSKRMTNFMQWYNAKVPNRDIAVGAGEIGCILGSEIEACFQVAAANRDVWAFLNYFNSMNASDHDWRVVPANFAVTSPVYTSGKGLVDFGGNAQSAGRLASLKTILTLSTQSQYTSPL